MDKLSKKDKARYNELVKKCIKMAKIFRNKKGSIDMNMFITCLYMSLDNAQSMAMDRHDDEVLEHIQNCALDLINHEGTIQ